MLDVHARMHQLRSSGQAQADPLAKIASELAADADMLCFDEFQVSAPTFARSVNEGTGRSHVHAIWLGSGAPGHGRG